MFMFSLHCAVMRVGLLICYETGVVQAKLFIMYSQCVC